MRTTIISISAVLLLFSGCRKNDLTVNPQQDYKGIIPLTIGNKWAFAAFAYDTSGNVLLSNNLSYEVSGDSMINGSKWFKLSNFLCANRSTGFSSVSNSGQLLLLKYPTAVQDSFYVSAVVGYLHTTSLDTAITVSLGTFHCYAYECHQPISTNPPANWREILYISPGIGPIKGEIRFSLQTNTREYLWGIIELTSYTLI